MPRLVLTLCIITNEWQSGILYIVVVETSDIWIITISLWHWIENLNQGQQMANFPMQGENPLDNSKKSKSL